MRLEVLSPMELTKRAMARQPQRVCVDEDFKGDKPADLPVEQPTKILRFASST